MIGGGSGAHSTPTIIRLITAPQPLSATRRLRSANPARLCVCVCERERERERERAPPKIETAAGFLSDVYHAGAPHHGTSIVQSQPSSLMQAVLPHIYEW